MHIDQPKARRGFPRQDRAPAQNALHCLVNSGLWSNRRNRVAINDYIGMLLSAVAMPSYHAGRP